MATQTNEEKRSSELDLVLSELTNDQIRFVIARQEFSTDKEAAEAIDIKPGTVYQWKSKAPIDEAVRLMAEDGLVTALHIRRRNLAKAMAVKVAALDSGDETARQKAATEIIEWEMGKAGQHTDITTGGQPVKGYISVSPDDWEGD